MVDVAVPVFLGRAGDVYLVVVLVPVGRGMRRDERGVMKRVHGLYVFEVRMVLYGMGLCHLYGI